MRTVGTVRRTFVDRRAASREARRRRVDWASEQTAATVRDGRVVWADDARPRIAIVSDMEGWAFDNIARQQQRLLADAFQIAVIRERDTKCRLLAIPEADCDALVVMFWSRLEMLTGRLRAPKVLTAVYDEHLTAPDGVCHPTFGRLLEKGLIDGVVCGNDAIRATLSRVLPADCAAYTCPDGVDLSMFPVLPLPGEFTVGWTGNAKRDRSINLKHEPEIRAACRIAGVRFLCQDIGATDAGVIPHDEMAARFYARISCYVCASSSEGTPNPVLEALACGRPIVTTRVGITEKVVRHGRSGLFIDDSDPETIAAAIETIRRWNPARTAKAARRAVRAHSWDRACAHWRRALRDAVGRSQTRARRLRREEALPDLSDEVTVFLISTGEPSLDRCREALARQDCSFRIVEVADVAPMNAAFQKMLDECRTPYFVQVDADMILHSEAVRTLHERARTAFVRGSTAYQVCFPLIDNHLAIPIYGVKIYRHALARRVPYRDVSSCEMDQIDRAAKEGYRVLLEPLTAERALGRHGTEYDAAGAYDRYKRLMEKTRLYEWNRWFCPWPRRFLDRYLERGDEVDLWSFLGCVAGLVADQPRRGEADARALPEPAFHRIAAVLAGKGLRE